MSSGRSSSPVFEVAANGITEETLLATGSASLPFDTGTFSLSLFDGGAMTGYSSPSGEGGTCLSPAGGEPSVDACSFSGGLAAAG